MTELICIVCPKGCHLRVDNDLSVAGHGCDKGISYAKKELTNPTRVITSTVKIKGALHKRLPVKTNKDIPKKLVYDAVKLLDNIEVSSPIARGSTILKDILETGVDFIATRSM